MVELKRVVVVFPCCLIDIMDFSGCDHEMDWYGMVTLPPILVLNISSDLRHCQISPALNQILTWSVDSIRKINKFRAFNF